MNRDLFRQVHYAWVPLGLTVALGIMVAGATIAQMVFLSKVVDEVFLGGSNLEGVRELLLLLLGAAVLRSGLLWVREVTAQRGAIRIKTELRERLLAHILRLGPTYAVGERTGELTTTATEGVEKLEAYFSRYLPQTVLSAFVPLLIAAYILPLDWASSVLLLVTAPVIPLLMVLVGSSMPRSMCSASGRLYHAWVRVFLTPCKACQRSRSSAAAPRSARGWRRLARSFGSER